MEFFNPPRQKHPFREGSSPAKQKNQGKERSFFVRRDRGSFNHNPKDRGSYSGKLSSHSQHVGNHRSLPGGPSFTGKPLCEGKSKQLFCRKNKTVFAKLAKAHKRQKRLKNYGGLGDTFNLKTNPVKSPTRNSILENRGTTSGLGGCQHVEKRSHKNCYSKREPIAEQYFHTSKKGRGIQTNYKPKKAESIYTLPTFQNGRSAGRKEYAQRRGPHVQIRSKRCLFYRSPTHKIQKTSKILVERETIRVSVHSFRTGTSTQDIHKITQVPISMLRRLNIRLIIYSDELLLMGSNYQEICLARDTAIFLFHQLGLVINWGEVYLGTPDKIGIFGDNYRQQLHDTISAGDKGK